MPPSSPKTSGHTDIFHREALSALVQADLALARAPQLDLQQPHLLGDVSIEWLQRELGAGTPGAALERLLVEDEHAGMTSRRLWELQWNALGSEAGLPASIFVKATPESPSHRATLAVLHMHELESKFYTIIQPEIPDLAPRAYYAKSYSGGRFLILLEDLLASGAKPYWIKDKVGIDHLRAVTITLGKLHARFWESERLHSDLSWVRPRTCRFGWPWLSSMTSVVRKEFAKLDDNELLPPQVAAVLALWDQHADRVFDYFEGLPHTVLHGDSHLGNTFSHADGHAGLFDWQVVFSGHGLRDFAYFLFSAISEEDRKVHEKSLFQLYLDTLAEHGVKLAKENAWNLYCLFVLDSWDAGMTSFVHGTYNHDPEGQRRGLLATAGAIVDNDIGGRLQHLIETGF